MYVFFLYQFNFLESNKLKCKDPYNFSIIYTDLGRLICNLHTVNHTQCETFRIFMSLRFYVKSFFKESKSFKTAFFAILWALNITWINFILQKVQIFKKSKFRAFRCVKMVDFELLNQFHVNSE